MPIIYNRGRFMYKKGGHQKKGAKFGTFLKILYIKKTQLYIIGTRLYIIRIIYIVRNRYAKKYDTPSVYKKRGIFDLKTENKRCANFYMTNPVNKIYLSNRRIQRYMGLLCRNHCIPFNFNSPLLL
jgi:hypothetical protein